MDMFSIFSFILFNFQEKRSTDLWVKAKAILYPTLIVMIGELLFAVIHLGRTEWTIYSLFVLNFIVTPALYAITVAIIPIV